MHAVGDCEGVRAMLHTVQERNGGKAKVIGRHVPTRFAVLHLIGEEVAAMENDLKNMVGETLQDEVEASFQNSLDQCAPSFSFY